MNIIEQIEARDTALTVPELAKLLNVSTRCIY
jgi:predicted DNA-binding transcriptional regulator YafY